MCSIQFHSFLLAFPKEKLGSNGEEAFHFRLFWTGNASDTCLPMWTLLHVSFKHILNILTSFNKNVLQYFSPESYAFWKSINDQHAVPCIPIFFTSIRQIQHIWSVVDLLLWNSHWWSPIVFSTYGVNLNRRTADKFVCRCQQWYPSIITTVSFITLFINMNNNNKIQLLWLILPLHIVLINLWNSECNASPPARISSVGIWQIPGNL
jgi:hypothetical protein